MANIFIKLHKKSQNVILQSILGTYSHLMWVRTEDSKNNLVRISTPDDLYEESINLLKKIKSEVDFEFLSSEID